MRTVWNEIKVYMEAYIYELQLTYTSDPICIEMKMKHVEDGTRGQRRLKSEQGHGH